MSYNSNATRLSGGKAKTNKGPNKKDEVQIKLPKALDYFFEKELINKRNRHIHIMDTFGPSRNTHHLSAKFYARHEQQFLQNAATFVPFVLGSYHKQQDTEANVYGWMPKTINGTNLLKDLNFVNAPKQRCSLTVFGEKLESDKSNARPSFNGLRFMLH